MPLTPISPGIGDARQKRLRQMLLQQMQQGRGVSRFGRFGNQRRGAMSAIRGVGPRAFIAGMPGRLGGGGGVLQPRGIGQAQRHTQLPFEQLPANPVGAPMPLPTDMLGGAQHPVQLPGGLVGGQPSGEEQSVVSNPFIQALMQGGGPSSPISLPGGLIPLGGGAYFDTSSGQIMGAGNRGNQAM